MRSLKVLEMINNGRIDELKTQLQEWIYLDSLKTRPGEKKRYTTMKKYFNYHSDTSRECLTKPCVVEFENRNYTSFTNSWSLILTTESSGEIELFDTDNGEYPDVIRLLRFDGIKKKIDFNKVIAEAKSKGYRLTKSEVGAGFKYLILYDGTYYKIGLLDISYGIIDNGGEAMTYHPDGARMPLTIQTDIGFCLIMPVFMHNGKPSDNTIVVEVK